MDEQTRIRRISQEGLNLSVLRVSLEDGTELLADADHPGIASFAASLVTGDHLDGSRLEALQAADSAYSCRRKAMDLLARAEQCRKGLESKLTRKGWDREAIETALTRLEAAGYLDDRRFAESWTRTRLRSRPEGPSKLVGSLMAKGIAGSVAKEAVQTVLDELGEDAADEALERAYEKLIRRRGITEEKLLAGLVRRGFPIGAARALIRRRSGEP